MSKIAADQTDAGKTMVTLSFDNIWYTTEVAAHEYRYSADGEDSWGPNDAEDSDGWMSMDTGCDPSCGAKLDDDDARVRITITSTPAEDVDTYIYQVRSVKKVTDRYDTDLRLHTYHDHKSEVPDGRGGAADADGGVHVQPARSDGLHVSWNFWKY